MDQVTLNIQNTGPSPSQSIDQRSSKIEIQFRDYMQKYDFYKAEACFIGLNFELGKPHA